MSAYELSMVRNALQALQSARAVLKAAGTGTLTHTERNHVQFTVELMLTLSAQHLNALTHLNPNNEDISDIPF